MTIFSELPAYIGELIEAESESFTLSLRLMHDDSSDAPWEREDGHGPVSDWRRAGYSGRCSKAPGELLLRQGSAMHARFYDYAEACQIALRDHWGIAPYRLDYSSNANGIWTVSAQWFHGRELLEFKACGDDLNGAIADCYAQHKATFPSARAYAAAAARADFDRLRNWCDGVWEYVGVIVKAYRNGIELGAASLWGIESDASDYLLETANELAAEAIDEARAAIENLCDCEAA